MGRQKGIGIVTVAAAGTPVRVTATETWCESYMVGPWTTAAASNTGRMFVGITAAAFKAGTAGLLGIIPIPTANVSAVFSSGKGSNGSHSFNLADLYIDSEVNGESVYVSYTG